MQRDDDAQVAPRALLLAAGSSAQTVSGTIVGSVVDITGAAIQSTDVTIADLLSVVGANSNVAGEFVIEKVPAGTHTLRFQAAGFMPKTVKVKIDDAEVTSIGRVSLDVAPVYCLGRMKPPVFHETRLHSGSKPNVSGIAVEGSAAMNFFAITLRVANTQEVISTMRTDENGRFQFADVAPGNYELFISSDEPIVKLRVRAGRDLEVRLTWAAWSKGALCL